MRKDFKNLDIYAAFQSANGAEWQKANGIKADWKTPEHIEVKPVYTKEDLEGMEHLNYAAGIPPYLRGPYSVMYTLRPWTMFTGKHEGAFRRYSFEQDVSVYDYEWRGTSDYGILHQCRSGTGC